MASYPQSPGDGDNEQTRSSSPQGSGGSGGYPTPGQPGQGYQQGGYPQGGYQPGGYQQPGQQPGYQQGAYQPGAYPGGSGGYPSQAAGQPSYYSQPGYPGAYPADRGGGPGGTPPPSFFGALFDVNFSRFATPGVIKVLYILIMVVVVLFWLGYTVLGFLSGEPLIGVLTFVGGGVISLLIITFYRVILEVLYAIVRMSEDIHHRR